MKIKWISFCSAVLFLLQSPLTMAAEQGNGWYVKRNRDHRQPEADASFLAMGCKDVYYVDPSHGDHDPEKVIYLTFDAGYENGNVEKIVEVLDRNGVKGSFFVLPHFLRKNAALSCAMVESGHLLCNHSVHHRDMSCMGEEEFKQELAGVEEACREVTGTELSRFFRPPEGRYSKRSLEIAAACGYKTVFWSFAYADWDNQKQPDPESAKKKVLENSHNGEIILLHPTSATNAAIMEDLIREWKKEGYRFATLDELP